MTVSSARTTIRSLWDAFWSGGIANPLSAIEQISYLLFLKRLENLDIERADDARRTGRAYESIFQDRQECKWSFISQQQPDEMLRLVRDVAFPFLKDPRVSQLEAGNDAFAIAMRDAVFIIPNGNLLARAVALIDQLNLDDLPPDFQGDIYEDLLSELSLAGKNGQFRTPRHIIDTMVQLVSPQLSEWVCDPAAGTSGFLVAVYRAILAQHTSLLSSTDHASGLPRVLTGDLLSNEQRELLRGERFVGYDFDTTMVRLGLMNLMLHGIEHPNFRYQDTLSRAFSPGRRYDVVLANPPFTGNIDKTSINTERLTLPTTKTELLFVELCLSLLVVGGRCAIIVPEGVLFGSTNAHVQLRKRLLEENQVEAIVSLPGGVFRPYTGVKTAILVFTRGGSTDTVWFYEVTGDGLTLDDRRLPAPMNNNLAFVPNAFANRSLPVGEQEWATTEARIEVEEHSWSAATSTIIDRDYSLAANSYRPHSADTAAYDDPREILMKIRELEIDISGRIGRIEKMIGADLDD